MDREVRLVSTGEHLRLSPDTPCVSKPAEMDYDGEATAAREGARGPVLAFPATDGSERTAATVRTPLGQRYAGDAVLIGDGDDRWVLCEVLP
jgi:hypothetical protein